MAKFLEKKLFATASPSISWLAWLCQKNMLDELNIRVLDWISKQALSPDEPFDDIEFYDEPISFLDQKFSPYEFSVFLCDIFSELLGAEYTVDPMYIAEMLLDFDSESARSLLETDDNLFLRNWKFDRHMRNNGGALVIFVANLFYPQVTPFNLSFLDLKAEILRLLNESENGMTTEVLIEQLKKKSWCVSSELLVSIARNDISLLVRKINHKSVLILPEKYLSGWKLATELIKNEEYIQITSLGYTEGRFDGIVAKVDNSILKRFFQFHNKMVDFEGLDFFEIALKQRAISLLPTHYIFGIPEAIRSFIIKWIAENKKVWLNRMSQKLLGREYLFDPSHIIPSNLLVYGTEKFAKKPERLGLVLANMVAEGRQERGQIHGSKVMTPREEIDLDTIKAIQISKILANDTFYNEFSVIFLETLASKVLSAGGIQSNPYSLGLAKSHALSEIDGFMIHIGREMYAETEVFFLENPPTTLIERRRAVANLIRPINMSTPTYLESIEDELRRELLGNIFSGL